MTSRLDVEGGARLTGIVSVPGDKSVSHRAVLLAARARRASRLVNLSPGADVAASTRLARALGASLTGSARETLVEPARRASEDRNVDCANSGTTMRLGAGLVAGWPGSTTLTGDASLMSRPMGRVVQPLRAMGATIDCRDGRAPLVVRGGRLHGAIHRLSVASAQVKGALLLAGLDARGPTTVLEPVSTRAHTEQMLLAAGVRVERGDGFVRVWPGEIDGLDLVVPGDPSAAAFWATAATICPGSELRIPGVYSGPGRNGYLGVLRRMGADIDELPVGEGVVELVVRAAELRGVEISDPEEVAACIDELPVLMVAAAAADGVTELRGAGELRVKESDRLEAIAQMLRAFGVTVETSEDGLSVRGGGLRAGVVGSEGDHRIAMAAAVAGLAARGKSSVTGWEAVAVSDPGFAAQLPGVRIG